MGRAAANDRGGGTFDGPQVERRFRDLLTTLKGRDLPIVFNSLGGIIGKALVLGRILRERRMAASVDESYPEGCKARLAADESCRRIMEANREIKAQLRTTGAVCSSACVYALLGASAGHVPAGARVGIHAATPTAVSSQPGWLTVEQMHNNRKRYILEMGANPDLQDAAIKTPPPGVHVLSREELVRYRVETSAPYESDWLEYQEPRGAMRTYMLKAITAARGTARKFRTSNLRMTRAERRPATSIEYQREAGSNEVNIPTVIRIAAGTNVRTLQRTTPNAWRRQVPDLSRSAIRSEGACGRRHRRHRDVFTAPCPSVVTRAQVLDRGLGAGVARAS